MSIDPFSHLEPSDELLLCLVFQYVDDSMLREIAAADYGMDFDAHLEALIAIKKGDVLAPMKWEPKEVLELIRWSEPDDPNWKPGSIGTCGHWMRLFSCAVLIRAAAEPENEGYFTGEESTIVQLVDSAMKLGREASLSALRFLCWRTRYRTLDDWNRPYFAVAILLLSVSLDECSQPMAEFLIAAAHSGELKPSELFGQCQKAQTWRDITRRISIASTASSKNLEEFSKDLLGSKDTA
jgi:hypothetical protein